MTWNSLERLALRFAFEGRHEGSARERSKMGDEGEDSGVVEAEAEAEAEARAEAEAPAEEVSSDTSATMRGKRKDMMVVACTCQVHGVQELQAGD